MSDMLCSEPDSSWTYLKLCHRTQMMKVELDLEETGEVEVETEHSTCSTTTHTHYRNQPTTNVL
jgi:hypothetical protein